MPMYEYCCPTCGGNFEKLVRSASKADSVVCPTCGTPAQRQLSTFAVRGGGSTSRNDAPPPVVGGG